MVSGDTVLLLNREYHVNEVCALFLLSYVATAIVEASPLMVAYDIFKYLVPSFMHLVCLSALKQVKIPREFTSPGK
jgi:hypothetical protein